MSKISSKQYREFAQLVLAVVADEASEEQIVHLQGLLQREQWARDAYLDLTMLQAQLAWTANYEPQYCGDAPLPAKPGERYPGAPCLVEPEQKLAVRYSSSKPASFRRRLAFVLTLAAMGLIVAAYWIGGRHERSTPDYLAGGKSVRATLIDSTRCVWDSGINSQPSLHKALREGDSLQLIEGLAEIQLTLGATEARLQLEGPAALVLVREGIPSLRYGKITLQTDGPLQSLFPVETPFGRVLLRPGVEMGISAFGSSAEVHVFRGTAIVESPWLHSPEQELTGTLVTGGEAIYLDHVGDSELRISHEISRPSRFTSRVSMESDVLSVGKAYVEEIYRAGPVGYWRFEERAGEQVRNQISDRFHGQLRGEAKTVETAGNRALSLGVDSGPGFVLIDGPWDNVLRGDFSMETWIKPSHFHLGSFLGFTGEFDWKTRYSGYGVLLEACGTSLPSGSHQPERIRFLHRSDLGATGGVQCFSEQPYRPRHWQHIVGLREGKQLALYLDGELIETFEDDSPTPRGLKLVIGQLYSETIARFFIGHIDEVAIYDRALTAEEIRQHHELLRPSPVDPSSI